jgi:hypothetical protein
MVVRFRQSMMDPSPFSLHLPRSCRRMTYGRCVLSASSVVRALASAASWRRAQQTGWTKGAYSQHRLLLNTLLLLFYPSIMSNFMKQQAIKQANVRASSCRERSRLLDLPPACSSGAFPPCAPDPYAILALSSNRNSSLNRSASRSAHLRR